MIRRILGAIVASVFLSVTPALSQTSVSHGLAMHGDLKYAAGFSRISTT